MASKWSIFVLVGSFIASVYAQRTCVQKKYSDNNINCVCNATYCDEFPPLGTLSQNQAAVYTSSQSGKRFYRQTLNFDPSRTPLPIKITANDSQKNQSIIGFGGAFTDAAGINLASLSPAAQQNLISSYFGPQGIGYTVGRTPIASCDFSTHPYSYDDVDGDLNLTNFALTKEDYTFKIPFIKMAKNLIGDKLKLFASPWSAPGWMKTTGLMKGGGSLKGEFGGPYYQTWANYIVRYFEEYAKNNISYWGLTMENEPSEGADINYGFQAMYFSNTMERDFAKGLWGQALRSNPITKNLKLMVCDDFRGNVGYYANTVLSDKDAYNYVDGVAVHWYGDSAGNAHVLTDVHNNFPEKYLLYTEACVVASPSLGDWGNGDRYAHSILEVLQHWVGGWTDWNICLDPQGGPNWVNNFVDSPIIVRNTSDEFEKQPMYYALGHFAKFIVPDSTVIGLKMENVTSQVNLEGVAALTPSGQKVIVLNNRDGASTYQVSVVNKQGAILNLSLEPRSFTTIVYSD